jgi:hypothetical protein
MASAGVCRELSSISCYKAMSYIRVRYYRHGSPTPCSADAREPVSGGGPRHFDPSTRAREAAAAVTVRKTRREQARIQERLTIVWLPSALHSPTSLLDNEGSIPFTRFYRRKILDSANREACPPQNPVRKQKLVREI